MIVNILFAIVIFLNSYSIASASDATLLSEQELSKNGFPGYESVNPNALIYPLKKLGEKIHTLFLLNKENRIKYTTSLVTIRFQEVVYIINYQKNGFLPETVTNYTSFLDEVRRLNGDSLKSNSKFKVQISRYVTILEILRDHYHANSARWFSIQQAIDSTNSFL